MHTHTHLHDLTGNAVGHRTKALGFKPSWVMSEGWFIFHKTCKDNNNKIKG